MRRRVRLLDPKANPGESISPKVHPTHFDTSLLNGNVEPSPRGTRKFRGFREIPGSSDPRELGRSSRMTIFFQEFRGRRGKPSKPSPAFPRFPEGVQDRSAEPSTARAVSHERCSASTLGSRGAISSLVFQRCTGLPSLYCSSYVSISI